MGPLPSLALLVVVQLLLDHADDNVIADEAALVHDLLGFAAERGLLGDLRAQHVAGCLRSEKMRRISNLGLGISAGGRDIPDGSS